MRIAMMDGRWRWLGVGLLSALAAGGAGASGAGDLDFFETKVRPLLAERCFDCHGLTRPKSNLRLDHISTILKGGERGPALVPGEPESSRLYQAIRYADVDLQMPPRGRLTDGEIEILRQWIAAGAVWPDEPPPSVEVANPQFDLQQRRASHWAWQPIAAKPPPSAAHERFNRHPIDRFVSSRLAGERLSPALPAQRRELIRRVYFDIIGLPPSPQEVEEFVADDSPDAYERVVTRLLESDHYGERWARHWMDLMRYSETYGHEFDYPIIHAYHYRDYLIRAFNSDLPYDDLVLEHLAGDLLDPPRRNPEDGTNESVVATGHFWLHQATHSPVDVRQDEAERHDNQIDVITKSFLGMTVACARCHDHKFDAISTADYYSLKGVLKSTRRQEAFLDPHGNIEKASEALDELYQEGKRRVAERLSASELPIAAYLLAAAEVRAATPPRMFKEAHDLKQLEKTAGQYRNQGLSGNKGQWVNDRQMWWTDAKPGDRLSLAFPVERAGTYQLSVNLTRARDYGIVQIYLGDARAGDPIDLYNPEVTSTGSLSLGEFHVADGEQRLTFEITGANENAIKSYMVGIDTVTMEDVAAEQRALDRTAELVQDRGLEADLLSRWVEALDDPALDQPSHPLHAFRELANRTFTDSGEVDSTNWAAHRMALLEELEKIAADKPAADQTLFEDFEDGFDGWFASGWAFGKGPTRVGDWRSVAEGAVTLAQPGVAHSGLRSGHQQGAIRSPSFTIDTDVISYRMAGDGSGTKIRLIIDGYFMDVYNGLLFGGMSFDVRTGGQFRWHHQGVAKYRGHRAYIEILDQGDGWLAVDEIYFGKVSDANRDLVAENLAQLKPPAGGLAEMASAVASRWQRARQALRGETASETELELCRLALRHRLFLAEDPAWTGFHARFEAAAEAVPAPVRVLAVQDGSGENEYVFLRGRHGSKGPTVPRRMLEAISGTDQVPVGPGSGRLELARRMFDPSNPLTPRVAVNRIWHHLFGRGLVPSVDNFGVLGEQPTHPDLLDWLAEWFRTSADWSIKELIRLAVTSETYRMASRPADPQYEVVDPTNRWLHRMPVRRLQGEAIRDAILAISGRLDRTLYGPPVKIHLTPFMDGRGKPGGSGPLDGDGRRSVYIEVRRNFVSPMMLTFDTPIPSATVGRRSISNVPAQALILMNDPLVVQQAGLWAERVLAESDSNADCIDRLYAAAFARAPTAEESADAQEFLARQAELYGVGDERDPRVWADLCHVLFNVKEFVFLN